MYATLTNCREVVDGKGKTLTPEIMAHNLSEFHMWLGFGNKSILVSLGKEGDFG